MTGYEAQKYLRCVELAKNLSLDLRIIGDEFELQGCGRFASIKELLQYLCGYDHGLTKAKGSSLWKIG